MLVPHRFKHLPHSSFCPKIDRTAIKTTDLDGNNRRKQSKRVRALVNNNRPNPNVFRTGRRVKVLWENNRATQQHYYVGTLQEFKVETNQWLVLYDDGQSLFESLVDTSNAFPRGTRVQNFKTGLHGIVVDWDGGNMYSISFDNDGKIRLTNGAAVVLSKVSFDTRVSLSIRKMCVPIDEPFSTIVPVSDKKKPSPKSTIISTTASERKSKKPPTSSNGNSKTTGLRAWYQNIENQLSVIDLMKRNKIGKCEAKKHLFGLTKVGGSDTSSEDEVEEEPSSDEEMASSSEEDENEPSTFKMGMRIKVLWKDSNEMKYFLGVLDQRVSKLSWSVKYDDDENIETEHVSDICHAFPKGTRVQDYLQLDMGGHGVVTGWDGEDSYSVFYDVENAVRVTAGTDLILSKADPMLLKKNWARKLVRCTTLDPAFSDAPPTRTVTLTYNQLLNANKEKLRIAFDKYNVETSSSSSSSPKYPKKGDTVTVVWADGSLQSGVLVNINVKDGDPIRDSS